MAKKNTGRAVAVTAEEKTPVARRFGDEIVTVDAVYINPAARPTKGGPWDGEADKVAWTDVMSGYACIILRDAKKHLRGFVAVPPGHPFFGRHVNTLVGYAIGVHGGLDYSANCQRHEPEYRSICHVGADGRRRNVRVVISRPEVIHSQDAAVPHDDAWWLGFSCNHPGDAWPGFLGELASHEPAPGLNEPTYKDERYVYRECVRLAAQLKAVEEGRHPSDADPGPTAMAYDVHDHGRENR
jgi:hypothetical protein